MERKRIITQDAFSVAPHLLGLPLASPSRRAGAMLLDIILVSILIKTGPAALGFAAAFVLWRIVQRGIFKWIFRTLAIAALIVPVAIFIGRADGGGEAPARTGGERAVERERDRQEEAAPPAAAVQELAARLAESDSTTGDSLRQALKRALAGADLRRLENEVRAQDDRIDALEDELEQAREGRGPVSMISAFADDLGLGFGWMALYFTAFLVWMRGQTPGKRLTGVRVMRLDAKPITWFIAFERFGGYAASLTLGLLGFLQILWDRNRQGLHDKAVETVVIRELRHSPAGPPR